MSSNLGIPNDPVGQATGPSPFRFTIRSREFIIYQISDAELETIAASGNSLDLTLFGLCAGAFISLLITVTTVSIPGARAFAAYVSATIIAALATAFFGWRGIRKYIASQKGLEKLRSENPPRLAHE